MDLFSILAFFLVVIPFWLIFVSRQNKYNEQVLATQKETNRLLTELIESLKKAQPSG